MKTGQDASRPAARTSSGRAMSSVLDTTNTLVMLTPILGPKSTVGAAEAVGAGDTVGSPPLEGGPVPEGVLVGGVADGADEGAADDEGMLEIDGMLEGAAEIDGAADLVGMFVGAGVVGHSYESIMPTGTGSFAYVVKLTLSVR